MLNFVPSSIELLLKFNFVKTMKFKPKILGSGWFSMNEAEVQLEDYILPLFCATKVRKPNLSQFGQRAPIFTHLCLMDDHNGYNIIRTLFDQSNRLSNHNTIVGQ